MYLKLGIYVVFKVYTPTIRKKKEIHTVHPKTDRQTIRNISDSMTDFNKKGMRRKMKETNNVNTQGGYTNQVSNLQEQKSERAN